MKHKAVVLGANYYIGLSIIRCLGKKGIHVAAIDYTSKEAYGFKSKYVGERLVAPHYRREPQAFLAYLIDYAKKQEVKPVLFPSADPYVEFVDANLDELRAYYLINMTEQGLFTKVMNKDTLAVIAREHGTAIPETVEISDSDFEDKVINTIGFPCLVKPVDSASFVKIFRHKMFTVHTMNELNEMVGKAKDENMEVIVQRIIPGFDDHMYTFDAYLDQNSKVTHWTTAHKLRQFPINFGASVYTEHKITKELYDIGAPFLEAIGWKGFAEIEFKKDAVNGHYYLIEVNVRTTNFNTMLEKVGFNAPHIAYMELTGEEIGSEAIIDDRHYTFWCAYEDLPAVIGYVKTGQLKLGAILKTYFRRKAHSTWAITDPLPTFRLLYLKVGGKLKRLFVKK